MMKVFFFLSNPRLPQLNYFVISSILHHVRQQLGAGKAQYASPPFFYHTIGGCIDMYIEHAE
jgi:hypothetical protein